MLFSWSQIRIDIKFLYLSYHSYGWRWVMALALLRHFPTGRQKHCTINSNKWTTNVLWLSEMNAWIKTDYFCGHVFLLLIYVYWINCCSIFLMPFFLMVFVQVFSMFLETLVDFIVVHKEDLQDWLFVLLTQLLKKMGADLLGSVQAKVQKSLDVTRYVIWKNWNPLFLLWYEVSTDFGAGE